MILASFVAFCYTVILLFLAAFAGESATTALAGGVKLLFWLYVIVATIWLIYFVIEAKIEKIIAMAEKKTPPPIGAAFAGGIAARACAIFGAYLLMVVTAGAATFGAWDKSVFATGIIFLVVSCAIASGTKVLSGK